MALTNDYLSKFLFRIHMYPFGLLQLWPTCRSQLHKNINTLKADKIICIKHTMHKGFPRILATSVISKPQENNAAAA